MELSARGDESQWNAGKWQGRGPESVDQDVEFNRLKSIDDRGLFCH